MLSSLSVPQLVEVYQGVIMVIVILNTVEQRWCFAYYVMLLLFCGINYNNADKVVIAPNDYSPAALLSDRVSSQGW